MGRVGVAEEVVKVAEDLLVGPQQEHADVVGLPVPAVKLEDVLHVAVVDEAVDLAVAIAGQIGEDAPCRVGSSSSKRWIGITGNS